MIDQKYDDKIQQIEELILRLPSIISCKVVTNDDNLMIEIHILSNNRRSPKQIVRDIQSSVMAKWQMEIDHKIISIAQIEDDMEQSQNTRLTLSRVEYAVEDIQGRALVELNSESKTYVGQENGLHTSNGSLLLIAQATLRAIEEYLGIGHCLTIDDVERTLLAKKQVIVVAITLLTIREEKYYIGTSFLNADENKSVVRATLDALNRLIAK